MEDIDYIAIEKSIEEYKKYVNSKYWSDLTSKELEFVLDKEKKIKYRKFLKYVINSLLYHMKHEKSFKFSHVDSELTCRNMLVDIFVYYQKLGFTKNDIAHIACDKSSKKH